MDIDTIDRQVRELMAFKARVEPMLIEFEAFAAAKAESDLNEDLDEVKTDDIGEADHDDDGHDDEGSDDEHSEPLATMIPAPFEQGPTFDPSVEPPVPAITPAAAVDEAPADEPADEVTGEETAETPAEDLPLAPIEAEPVAEAPVMDAPVDAVDDVAEVPAAQALPSESNAPLPVVPADEPVPTA